MRRIILRKTITRNTAKFILFDHESIGFATDASSQLVLVGSLISATKKVVGNISTKKSHQLNIYLSLKCAHIICFQAHVFFIYSCQ